MNSYVSAIPLVSFDTAGLTTSYQAANASGLPNACFSINITNASGNVILISYDGTTDHEAIGANDNKELLKGTGDHAQFNWCFFPKGRVFYVKSATSSAGAVYISGYYL